MNLLACAPRYFNAMLFSSGSMSCRYDTATPSVDPVHVSSITVPGGYDLSTLNTTQVRAAELWLAFLRPPPINHLAQVACSQEMLLWDRQAGS